MVVVFRGVKALYFILCIIFCIDVIEAMISLKEEGYDWKPKAVDSGPIGNNIMFYEIGRTEWAQGESTATNR